MAKRFDLQGIHNDIGTALWQERDLSEEELLKIIDDNQIIDTNARDCSTCYYYDRGCLLSGGEPCDPERADYSNWKPKEKQAGRSS